MKKNATILTVATLCALVTMGVLVQAQRRTARAQKIDAVLRQMAVAFQKGDIESARILCTPDCAPKAEEWMSAVSNDLQSSLGWHPLANPPPAGNPIIEKGCGTGNFDYFPDARWGWPSHYGQFYRFRQENGEWRFAGYYDVVR